ncbi:hypothetical protein GGG16DRAFT_53573 [Schizophyllum commune]
MTDSRRLLIPDEHPGPSQRDLKARYSQSVAGLKLKKYQKTLDFLQKERSALANEIPVEILQQIFDLTVAPTFLLTPGFAVREDAWLIYMRTKRSLPLVCRSWYLAANAMLYRDIGLRSVGQVAALLETLQDTPTLASLITSLSFACHVTQHHEDAYARDATLLLRLCHAMRSVSFVASNPTMSTAQLLPLLNPDCPPLTGVIKLHVNEGFDIEALFSDRYDEIVATRNAGWYIRTKPLRSTPFMSAASDYLVELSLPFNDIVRDIPELTFHSLISFSCSVARRANASFAQLTLRWELPLLQRFTISILVDGPYLSQTRPRLAYEPLLGPFASRHGAQLRYMHILDRAEYRDQNVSLMEDIQSALDSCPRLEHLVLPSNIKPTPALRHLTVQWVDVWEPQRASYWLDIPSNWNRFSRSIVSPAGQFTRAVSAQWQQGFPSFQRGRTIDVALSFLRDLPWVLRPDVWAGVTVAFDYPAIAVRHSKFRIRRADLDRRYISPRGDEIEEISLISDIEDSDAWETTEAGSENDWEEQSDEADFKDRSASYEPVNDNEGSSIHSSDSSWVASDEDDGELESQQWTHEDILRVFSSRTSGVHS